MLEINGIAPRQSIISADGWIGGIMTESHRVYGLFHN